MREGLKPFVLIIQHDPKSRDEVAYQLQKMGLKTTCVESASLAYPLLKFLPISLIVIDERGDFDALSLDELHHCDPSPPVISFSLTQDDLTGGCPSPRRIAKFESDVANLIFPSGQSKSRAHDRFQIQVGTHWDLIGGAQMRMSRVSNLSIRGAYINSAGILPRVGDVISMEFYYKCEMELHFFFAKAIVRWVNSKSDHPSDNGFGVEFVLLNESSHNVLAQLFQPLIPDLATMEKRDLPLAA